MEKMVYKLTGYLILLGFILVGISTVLHPITINPWAGSTELHRAAKAELWMLDHTIMMIAMLIWLLALICAVLKLCKNKTISIITSLFFMIALTIWLIIIGMELTIFPAIFKNLTEHTHHTVGSLFFGYGLFSGYIAMSLIWFGIGLFSIGIKGTVVYSKRFYRFGLLSSVIGVIGTIVTILIPNLILLLVSTIIPSIWITILSFRLIRLQKS
jgi:hypothetical protein